MIWCVMAAAWAAVDIDERLAVADPAVHGELALFPIVDKQVPAVPEGDYGTLEASLAAGSLAISELDSSGSVPTLVATNTGDKTVLLLAGEVITGGKQDRVVVTDTLVPPGDPVPFAVNCVEQGRWNAGTQGLSFGFGGKAELGLKQTVHIQEDQGATWSKVSELNAAKQKKVSGESAALLAPSSGTYRASLDNPEVNRVVAEATADLLTRLGATRDVVGVVVAVDGEILGTELFGHPHLFDRHRDSLVRGFALDAASDAIDDRPGVPPTREAAAFVKAALDSDARLRGEQGAAAEYEFSDEELEGKDLRNKGTGTTIHKSVYKKK